MTSKESQGKSSARIDSLRELARRSANELRERDLFGERRLYIPYLLKLLNLNLKMERGLRTRGMIKGNQIKLREGKWSLHSRLVILHEIGHAVLKREYPELARGLPHPQQEAFATHFAISMLLSDERRAAVAERFRLIASPTELADAAREFRFPIATFLQLASWDGEIIIGPEKIWLTLRYSVNRYTHREPKLRVISAHFDPTCWFIPTNKGVDGLVEDSGWLLDIPVGVERQRMDTLFKLQKAARQSAGTKFENAHLNGRLAALSLKPIGRQRGPYLIAMLSLPAENKRC